MDKQKLLKELKEKFNKLKEEYKFKATYEEIEELTFIEDQVLNEQYVSENFRVQLITRLVDSYGGWLGLLHNWMFPNPHDLIILKESKSLTDEQKKEITQVTKKIIYFIRKSKIIIFQDKSNTGKFIDEIVSYKKEFYNFLMKYHKHFSEFWQRSDEEEWKKTPDYL